MKIIIYIASLLNLLILHGLCNVSQNFDEDEMISCHFHFVCDLNETRKVRQLEAECSQQGKDIFWESSKEVFGLEGVYLPEEFELHREDVCSRTDEERKKGFKELAAILTERSLVVCMDRSSELCKEIDYLIKKWAEYVKEIMESEECEKKEEPVNIW